MIKKIILITILAMGFQSAFSQAGNGSIKGIVKDKSSGELLPFVNLVLEQNGAQKGGASTDFDGKYSFSSVAPGTYTLKVSFVGYKPYQLNGVLVKGSKMTPLNIDLESGDVKLDEFIVVDYEVPLIDKDGGASGGTVTRDQLAKMPGRSAGAMAATVGGVATDANGSITSVRGSRSEDTYYYIDGIKVRGSSSLPKSAIQEVTVITGGQPAMYGDATGGVISITTRGPSSFYFGGVEYVTSGYKFGDKTYGLDNYGYNLLEGSISGPLFMKKDEDGNEKPILGFFLSGNASHVVDSRPFAIDQYKVKDEIYQDLLINPARPALGGGAGIDYNAEFLHSDAFEKIKFRQNVAQQSASLAGKIDVNTGPLINLSFGGSFNWNKGNNYSYASSLFNSDNYSNSRNLTWRVYGKLTQRFANNTKEGEENKSLIKNAYYTVMVDYSKVSSKTVNTRHEDRIFDYGHVGTFETSRENSYEFDAGQNMYIHNGFRDVLVTFDPSEKNSDLAAITSQYYALSDAAGGAAGNYQNQTQLLQGNALRNGDAPRSIYGLWSSLGTQPNGYSKGDNGQFRVSASGSADIKDHAITVGFEYEQRSDRGYSVAPSGLWTRMRQLTNSHITELDLNNYSDEYRGTYNYRTYERLNSAQGEYTGDDAQSYFDYNLRNALGYNTDGTDFINTDAIDPSFYSIDFFSADELINGGFGQSFVNYFGYDHTGKKITGKPSFDDFFDKEDDFGNKTRPVAAFEPIYFAGFIMDKFAFNDIIFNVGLRIDRFDANQQVLKDPYLLQEAKTVKEVADLGSHPSNIGEDYVVYVNDINAPTAITGYRDGSVWYNAEGLEISDPTTIESPNGIAPYLADGVSESDGVNSSVFEDYTPTLIVMPRIAFSFPISDEALFFAHYDVLSQRPTTGLRLDPMDYLFIRNISGTDILNNPALKPSRTIDYEVGFQQVLTKSSSLKIAGFYREQRDQIAAINIAGAYPKTYQTFGNLDFGTVKGLTLTYDQRKSKNLWLKVSYTLQFAEGTGSNAGSNLALIRSGQPSLKTIFPYNYDQRHAVTGTIDYRYGEGSDYNGPVWFGKQVFKNTGVNLVGNFASGTPYSASKNVYGTLVSGGSPILEGTPFGSRNPGRFYMNMQIDRNFLLKYGKDKTANFNVYVWVQNILNTRNTQGVYRATGNADDDGYLSDAQFQQEIAAQNDEQAFREYYQLAVNNPFNYALPRTIRLGIKLDF
jgi:hypothetical protein